jgi:uncharacterized protein (DUF1015 family)
MARIEPFRAWRYDPSRVDVSSVVTQPYDKISPEMQARYHAASPHNLVRIILGKPEPDDRAGANVYTRAAGFFADWRRQGIFCQDQEPSLYAYVQRFTPPGGKTELERRGFIGLGRIEDYAANVVFRHEQTLAKPKADRLELLRATRAHFGQIFTLYSDPAGEVEADMMAKTAPVIDIKDEYGVSHLVWQISDHGIVRSTQQKMTDKQLIIADGHHRYETALNYRNERRAVGGTAESSPFEFVMMTFVNMDSPGLVILPTHRVVHGLENFSADRLKEDAKRHFSTEEVDPSLDATRAVGILRAAGQAGTAMLAVTADRAFLLDTPKTIGSNFFSGLSLRQQGLDVVQLHKCLLEGVLGISEEAIREQRNISYVRDTAEALTRVRSGGANVAFLMNPVRMKQMRDVAFAGEVLPQKSTDFYPKLLSGLTIYALE